MNRCLQGAHVPEWMTKIKTTLVKRDPLKGTAQKNYQRIICLQMMQKILTAQIMQEIYYSLTSRGLFPEEQKGCRKGSIGTAGLLYIRGAFNRFPEFFIQAFKVVVDSSKFTVIAIHVVRWLANVYNFRFKWTATAAIGINPNKAWLSQLVHFKYAIWTWGHFRRRTCNKILFQTWEKCQKNVWNASD